MNLNKKIVVIAFLLTPIIASIISCIHIVDYLNLGNPDWMSYFLAITFEIGSIASFVALSVLDKLKKGMVLFIFFVLFFMQLIGNVYFSFSYINIKLLTDPSWLNSFIELVRPIYDAEEVSTYKFILAMIIGVPIPLVSLSFLKSLVDYLKVDDTMLPQPITPVTPVTLVTPTTPESKSGERRGRRGSADPNVSDIAPFTNTHE